MNLIKCRETPCLLPLHEEETHFDETLIIISLYLHSKTIFLDEPIWTDEVHTLMNDTHSRDVTRKRRYK